MMDTLKILTCEQGRLTTAVLDAIIPSTTDCPGAGAIGAARQLDEILGDQRETRRPILDVLNAISEAVGTEDFSTLNAEAQERILRSIESTKPEEFSELVKQTYNIYYTNIRVRRAIGFMPENPQPSGYPQPAPFDPVLLDGVRKRNRTWRKA